MVRGQWENLARLLGLHPYSFSKDILGFLMTTESGPRFNVSSEGLTWRGLKVERLILVVVPVCEVTYPTSFSLEYILNIK